MERDHLALPYEYLDEMSELDDAEFGLLVRALMKYSMTGEPVPRDGNMRFYAARVMAREDRYQKAFTEVSDKRKSAGKRGAARRWGDSKDENDMANDSNAIFAMANDGNAIFAMANDSNTMANDSKNGYTEAEAEAEAEAYTEADGSFLAKSRKEPKEISPSDSRARKNDFLTLEPCAVVGAYRTRAPVSRDGPGEGARASPKWDDWR